MKALIKGLSVTLRHIFRPKFTVEYPEERKKLPERSRWLHRLQRHNDGLERCVACMLCSSACPTGAIYIVGEENTEDSRISHGERYARIWDLDLGRCIFCGYCVEACPEEALYMSDEFELACYSREGLIIHKEDLVTPPGTPPKFVWMGYYPSKIKKAPLTLPEEIHKEYEKYLKGD